MKPFRFRMERLLAHRERIEEERRAAFAKAQESVRRALADVERTRTARDLSLRSLEVVEAPGAASRRHDLILYTEFLEARLRMLRDEVVTLRREEEKARGALLAAARDRKMLARLRERRRIEHRHQEGRAEQAALDDIAQRSAQRTPEPAGTPFPDRQKLPADPPHEEL